LGRDGTVLYTEINPKTSRDMLMLLPDWKTTPLRVTPANEGEARFSPGTFSGSGSAKGWIAYASDDEGSPHQLNVILNWSGEAERSTAAGNQ
jgi:hypothetical protein